MGVARRVGGSEHRTRITKTTRPNVARLTATVTPSPSPWQSPSNLTMVMSRVSGGDSSVETATLTTVATYDRSADPGRC
jgi:hypothetical protein